MSLLQLAGAELGRDVAAHSDADVIRGKNPGNTADVALLRGFGLRRLVAMALRRQLGRLNGGCAQKRGHKDEPNPLHDYELLSLRDSVAELLPHECA